MPSLQQMEDECECKMWYMVNAIVTIGNLSVPVLPPYPMRIPASVEWPDRNGPPNSADPFDIDAVAAAVAAVVVWCIRLRHQQHPLS